MVKVDVKCAVQGDVVLECIHLDGELSREVMMFRVMFNTAFVRSNMLMLGREDIDIMWDAKERFNKDFRVEVPGVQGRRKDRIAPTIAPSTGLG